MWLQRPKIKKEHNSNKLEAQLCNKFYGSTHIKKSRGIINKQNKNKKQKIIEVNLIGIRYI
jgi:hypothetical protein